MFFFFVINVLYMMCGMFKEFSFVKNVILCLMGMFLLLVLFRWSIICFIIELVDVIFFEV